MGNAKATIAEILNNQQQWHPKLHRATSQFKENINKIPIDTDAPSLEPTDPQLHRFYSRVAI